jgi:hypothetical protein
MLTVKNMALIETIEKDGVTYRSSLKVAADVKMTHSNFLQYLNNHFDKRNIAHSGIKEGGYVNRRGREQKMRWISEDLASDIECLVLERRDTKEAKKARMGIPDEIIFGGTAE